MRGDSRRGFGEAPCTHVPASSRSHVRQGHNWASQLFQKTACRCRIPDREACGWELQGTDLFHQQPGHLVARDQGVAAGVPSLRPRCVGVKDDTERRSRRSITINKITLQGLQYLLLLSC
jgi:hypothetical protein